MAHPFASQSARSAARRMSKIGGKSGGGKAWGSTATQVRGRKSYPSKNAGSQVPYFAEGGSVRPRADRLANGGTPKSKGHTTNVIVNLPPEGGAAPTSPPPVAAAPVPLPVPRPPVAVAGGPPPGLGPVPPGALPGGPPLRPPGMPPIMAKRGGSIKRQMGGRPATPPGLANRPVTPGGTPGLPAQASDQARTALANRPALPTQAQGTRPFKKGGGVPKAQLGMAVPRNVPPAAAAPALAGRAAAARKIGKLARRGAVANKAAVNRQALRDAQASANPVADRVAGAEPPVMKRGGSKKAKGGAVHSDEAQDKKLMLRMMKEHEKKEGEKMANGGRIKQGGDGDAQYGEPGGYPVMQHAGGGGLGRLEKRSKGEV
jgi:hypothetical protein